jgi:hypothetical protein
MKEMEVVGDRYAELGRRRFLCQMSCFFSGLLKLDDQVSSKR